MGQLGSGSGSSYPGTLDTAGLEVDSPNAGKTKARANVPNDIYAAVVSIETELGVDPAGSKADVKTFLQTQHAADGTHGAITTASAITSSVATGTAPLVIASTTEVANLKAATATKLATARLISGVAFDGSANITLLDQILHVRDEKASGTAGGSSAVGDQVRVLNTVVKNTIAGASLAANEITLPAGTYTISVAAPCYRGDRNRARLVNVTDAVVLLLGSGTQSSNTYNVQTSSLISGAFTLAAAKALNITHYIATALATNGLGLEASDTFVEVYTSVLITKIG